MPTTISILYSVIRTEKKSAQIVVPNNTAINRTLVYELIDTIENNSYLPDKFELLDEETVDTDYDIDFDYDVEESDETTVALPVPVFTQE